ncbi:UPF0223 family protein [Bacillus marasmi]|uniref:UPF0223 family protein n=1 Tax=Bacillus marasmi TaxID=1926279 RepID=UPI0011CAEF15|nr:UPF0223 family protein [Bacillus marasmi]
MEYQYPIDPNWNTEEIIDVIKFFESVEKGYETGIDREILMKNYRRFKEIVPSKSEEKKIFDEFEETSGYSSYLIIKKSKETNDMKSIKM